MNRAELQKMQDAGLISAEQQQRIIEYFRLKEDTGNRFLAILSLIGAVLIMSGITLLIAAHWNEIPRSVKVAVGITLMLGAHAGGWWLREVRKDYVKTGEALHLIGSGLFLGNIALLGQIYHIVSRAPNAFLIWWIGIAALPWLLRSKPQQVLLLLGFGIWFGLEINSPDSWIFCGSESQVLLYSLVGLGCLGAGWCLRRGPFAFLAEVTEKFGWLIFMGFFYPLTAKFFYGGSVHPEIRLWVFPTLGLLILAPLLAGVRHLRISKAQWRWTWFAALLAMIILMGTVWFGVWQTAPYGALNYRRWGDSWAYLVTAPALFVFCLLMVQVGLQERSRFLVNLGVTFIALDLIMAYFDLFGSMARTGLMFLFSGIFLVLFGVYLEKKRRKLMQRIRPSILPEVP